jgi:hypothetical protein
MQQQPSFRVSPTQVPLNATLTVLADAQQFPQLQYLLFDSNGKIIRKGSVSDRLSEFRLNMLGLPAGNYEMQMGSTSEKFSVVY